MNDRPVLDGVWQMTRAELAGEAAPELVVTKSQLELTAGAYAVRFDGEIVDQGAVEIDVTAGSPTLLLRGREGTNAGRTIPCLVQMRGDRLRICFGLNGTVPTGFTTDARNARYLAVYRRT